MALVALVAGLALATLLVVRTTELPSRGAAPGVADTVAVIPARDEADVLPLLLADLAGQTTTPARVVVVDDGSSDATAALAEAAGAEVRTAPPTPPGWNPKSWALHQGFAGANEANVLLLDADVRLAPDAVSRVLGRLEAGGGLVTVAPRHDVGRAVEALSLPFNLVAVMGAGGGWRRRRGGAHAAFGPCLALSRQLYERVGGHERDRGDLLDDVALAARVRAAGEVVHLHRGGGTVRYRMYRDGVGRIVDGWTKNIAAGATRTPVPASLAVVAWVTALLVPLVLLAGARSGSQAALAAAAWLVVALHTGALARLVSRFPAAAAAAAPLLAVVFVAVVARSALALALRRPVRWKGRPLVQPRREPCGG